MQSHRTALCDLLGFLEVRPGAFGIALHKAGPCSGQIAAWNLRHVAASVEAPQSLRQLCINPKPHRALIHQRFGETKDDWFPAKSRQTTLIDRTIEETHQTQHGERAQTVFARVCEPFLVGRHGLESMPALNLGVRFLELTRSRRRMSPRCAFAR